MKKPEKSEKVNKIGRFLYWKILLIVALVLEIAALLMRKGIMTGTEQLVSGFTVAGGVLVFIYLVIDGLSQKYRHYSKKWGMGPYAEKPDTLSEHSDD